MAWIGWGTATWKLYCLLPGFSRQALLRAFLSGIESRYSGVDALAPRMIGRSGFPFRAGEGLGASPFLGVPSVHPDFQN
jgi:hypothetical protein